MRITQKDIKAHNWVHKNSNPDCYQLAVNKYINFRIYKFNKLYHLFTESEDGNLQLFITRSYNMSDLTRTTLELLKKYLKGK